MTLLKALSGRTFRSLQIRNYRLFFCGQLVSLTGTWMQSVAQAWLVLRLTDSGAAVGMVTGLQFVPMLVAGAWGGVVADRVDKRKALVVVQSAMGAVALALAVVTATEVVELWMVYLAAFLLGCATVIETPTRQAFVTEMVGPESLPNAIGLNSALFNGSRVVGPAVAGFLIVGAGLWICFLVNAVSFLGVIGALVAMRPEELHPAERARREPGQVRAGLRYVWSSPERRWTLLLVAAVGTFAFNFNVVLPLMARFTFGADAGGFGLLTSAIGVGALVGALVTAARAKPSPSLLVRGCGATAALMAAAAVAPTMAVELVVLVLLGAAVITFMTTANAMLQLGSEPAMRGRVMALYALVFLGSTPIGGPIVGTVAEQFGPRAGLGVGAAAAFVATAAGAIAFRRAAVRGEAAVTAQLPAEPAAA
ncbi:MAG TPA: MFS transporter [Acidimicrobiales bacterium]|nr:MFS transporter [Acidimicrobiales bacterium]